ncbi:MAG: fluoride efflux transporter CrcB [Gammaproteobacteria bacterium]|nr:fluoride efflux transporter CrcB [Gammaproteobacteria bacterium]MCK5262164.1 fluoride efflux transporter CrcB [Gammaproteobacteria bacterium]
MKTILFIACGGAIGAVLRYGASLGVYSLLGRGFPYGTLFVNITGSLLMGVLSILMLERFNVGPEWRAAILVGLLGSFTTFSTFSFETLNLLEQGDMMRAMANIAFSVIVCLAAVWLGVSIGRQL